MDTETNRPATIAKGLLISLVAAALITLLFVMPAEYGKDPTGVGKALGLTKLAIKRNIDPAPLIMEGAFPAIAGKFDAYEPPLIGLPFSNAYDASFHNDSLQITLAPGEQVEYKATMNKGGMLVFSWASDAAEIYSDFHGDPGDRSAGEYPEGYYVRYAESEKPMAHGSIVAPFAGNHGWYWLNYNEQTVTIELTLSGYYDEIHELGRSMQY